ncbi:MAG TPA: hypothetical protein VGB33_00820 [Acidimicrobiia bacterium]
MPSTQDVARSRIDDLPVLVVAAAQTEGRGRSGTKWLTADRALATSLAFRHEPGDSRPLSLMAGLAATLATEGTTLKWPNDVLRGDAKTGGILVERSDDVTVVGLGLNLWWPEPPPDATALFGDDPGEDTYVEIGALWGAELNRLIDSDGWPIDRYRDVCTTLGREISWEPDGVGRAVDVTDEGGLVVEVSGKRHTIHSGAVRHVRSA